MSNVLSRLYIRQIKSNTERKFCPLCKNYCNSFPHEDRESGEKIRVYSCERCGTYEISFNLFFPAEGNNILEGQEEKYKGKEYILSGVTRNAHENGHTKRIKKEEIPDLIDSAPVPETPLEMIDKIIPYLCFRPFFAEKKINKNIDYPLFYAEDEKELNKVLIEAACIGYLIAIGDGKYKLTTKGWEQADKLRRLNPDSRQAFVAMWFNEEEMGLAYEEGFFPALDGTGFKPYRVDRDLGHNDFIVNKIIAEIRKSGLLVVDLTGIRHSVIFEAGFAKGLGIEVIWTCSEAYKEEMEQKGEKLPFDVDQFPIIFWKDHDDLKKQLIDKIEALGLSTKSE